MMETGALRLPYERRTMSGSTLDIISNLPRNVLEEILMRLTIQDAGRTSVLSRKWRYIWTTLPELVFMEEFCKESLVRARSDRLMMTIYKVLLLHHGPILKFTLSLSNLTSCPEIDQLIVFLSNNGIREFTLHIQTGPFRSICCRNTSNLTDYSIDLNVKYCLAPIGVRETLLPTTLNHLRYLQLHDVCFGELDEVSAFLCFIRSSPNLEEIEIRVSGIEAEMEFIKLLLAKSPVLETMDGYQAEADADC
ncbi:hypothetical protein RHMOL_Rhmol12G0073100 [Rhododendron molle]|uniref:Uncharacterized protein n=1 Tax=Rhododendron molle TaxID=49168 RepID=A0ACC0LGX8_RHOML|nr:hypothetical protein RHMOL_Rhmol12G0073100 [Rhododendron molle]